MGLSRQLGSKEVVADLGKTIRALSPQSNHDLESIRKQDAVSYFAGAGIGALSAFRNGDNGSPKATDFLLKSSIGGLAGLFANRAAEKFSRYREDAVEKKDLKQVHSKSGNVIFSPESTVEFITDISGDNEFFKRLVEESDILSIDDNGDIQISENGILVHGGNMVDLGPGDIRLVKAFLELKERYPGQVYWVLGERDISKLRYASELSTTSEEEDVGVEKLKSIQTNTMDSPNVFDFRKAELEKIKGTDLISSVITYDDEEEITDEHVIQSFINSVDPHWKGGPWMLKFIEKGHIALVLGDVLIVHGGVQTLQMGHVPAHKRELDLRKWVKGLNEWKSTQIQDFKSQPNWMKDADSSATISQVRGGEYLIDYASQDGAFGTSVITSSFLDGSGEFAGTDESVEAWFKKNGIRRVLVGGKEAGPCPLVIRKTGGITILNANYRSSVSNPVPEHGNNIIHGFSTVSLTTNTLSVEGKVPKILSESDTIVESGTSHGYTLHSVGHSDNKFDRMVGRMLELPEHGHLLIQTILRETGDEKDKFLVTAFGEEGIHEFALDDVSDEVVRKYSGKLMPAFALRAREWEV